MLFDKIMKTSALIMILAMMGTAEGRAHSRSGGLLAPRRYQYSRAIDPVEMIGEIFTAPIYMNSLMGRNDLSRLARSTSPSYDVSVDTEAGLVELTVELPGVRLDDLDIELVDTNMLRIRASRKLKHNGSFIQQEFDQSFQLEKDVDPNHIKASLVNGILTVQAKRKEKSVKKITILTNEEMAQIPVAETKEMGTETMNKQESEDIVVEDDN